VTGTKLCYNQYNSVYDYNASLREILSFLSGVLVDCNYISHRLSMPLCCSIKMQNDCDMKNHRRRINATFANNRSFTKSVHLIALTTQIYVLTILNENTKIIWKTGFNLLSLLSSNVIW